MSSQRKKAKLSGLKTKLGTLKKLKGTKQRSNWLDGLDNDDIRTLCRCIKKIVDRPDRYATQKTKERLRKRRELLTEIAKQGTLGDKRAQLKKLVQKGGFIIRKYRRLSFDTRSLQRYNYYCFIKDTYLQRPTSCAHICSLSTLVKLHF